jgi:hypothetical protein
MQETRNAEDDASPIITRPSYQSDRNRKNRKVAACEIVCRALA